MPLVLVLLALVVLAALAFLLLRPPSGPAPAPSSSAAPSAPASPSPVAAGSLWEVAFTTPVLPPDDPSKHTGGLNERLVALMDGATRTLDVAVYDFDLVDVAQAMARAAGRGVRVRMVTDTDTLENSGEDEERIQDAVRVVREARIPIVDDRRGAIMHHKFTVVDGEWIQMGSWNYSDGDTYRLNNNLAVFRSPELAANYTAEFEKMFAQRRFGPNKAKGVPHPVVSLSPLRIETYFAAQDAVASRIVERVGRAQRKIHFLAFSFTHDGIAQAMLARKQTGAELQGVFETTGSSTRFSEYGRMKEAGVDVYLDGSGYAMHHKVLLLDDHTTIFGSFNFSENADQSNDENLLIVDDAAFTAVFEQEYQRVLATAKNPPARKQPAPKRTERQREP